MGVKDKGVIAETKELKELLINEFTNKKNDFIKDLADDTTAVLEKAKKEYEDNDALCRDLELKAFSMHEEIEKKIEKEDRERTARKEEDNRKRQILIEEAEKHQNRLLKLIEIQNQTRKKFLSEQPQILIQLLNDQIKKGK